MSYELIRLEELIGQLIPELNTAQQLHLKETIIKETQRLALAIPANSFALPDAGRVEAYIHWHQEGLVNILNQFTELKTSASLTHEIATAVLRVLQQLEKLFPKEMASDIAIPDTVFKQEAPIFRRMADQALKELQHHQIDPELIEVVKIPLAFLYETETVMKLSYRGYYYLKGYLAELITIDYFDTKYNSPTYLVTDKLVLLDFNHILLLDYCIGQIKKHHERNHENDTLAIALKHLKQLPVVSGPRYVPHLPGVAEHLIKWVKQEISFQKPKVSVKPTNKEPEKLALGVGPLAFLAEITYKKLLQKPAKNRVVDFITENFSTVNTKKLSKPSFKNKMRQPSATTLRVIKRLLLSLITDIDNWGASSDKVKA